MRLKVTLDMETSNLLKQMAEEAELFPEELAKIAIYNLIALWMQDAAQKMDISLPVPPISDPSSNPTPSA